MEKIIFTLSDEPPQTIAAQGQIQTVGSKASCLALSLSLFLPLSFLLRRVNGRLTE